MKYNRGYTLVELMVAVGLFAIVMALSSGAYLMMIGVNREAQGIATGINDLSFALETMTRTIRTGGEYCSAGPCFESTFSFRDIHGSVVTYSLDSSTITQTVAGVPSALTDSSVTVTSLRFISSGTSSYSATQDIKQASVIIVVSGTVASSANKTLQAFTVETLATMRAIDL